jgi:hypothetical protein
MGPAHANQEGRHMSRYVVLYSAPLSVKERFAEATPQQAAAGMQLWVDWAQKLGGKLIDPGKPLGQAMTVTQGGAKKTDSDIVGMSILEAGSMDEALGMVKDHHHLRWSADTEITVLEEVPIPELQAHA